jgi:hypothetical protein
LVALTVILGGVVGVVVFDVPGSVMDPAPTASFDFEYNESSGDILVTHTNGDTIRGENLRFGGAALEKTGYGDIWTGEVEPGDSATVNVKVGETLQLIWRDQDSDKSVPLVRHTVSSSVDTGSGSISSVTADATADKVSVDIGTLSKTGTGGTAALVVDNQNGGSDSRTVSSGDSETVSMTVNGGDKVVATLYETSSHENQLGQQSDTAATASISDVKARNGNSWEDVKFYLSFNNAGSVYVVAENERTGEVQSATYSTSDEYKDIDFPDQEVDSGDKIIVTVYDNNKKQNWLAEGSHTAN